MSLGAVTNTADGPLPELIGTPPIGVPKEIR
ncbi:MAG: hypothetical protein AW09_001935 [Candidatus Accumulibacter phosphatis]|uniref:Uncharacterized protein n=1 Tax=Candidatus Accumulibacter phosphatis TaxID=327160 RepID=A0A080LW30_9PROT|nr:MAG: hypothetical protein AW09_001935 [Candidatus Accumulibacter phosphatis]